MLNSSLAAVVPMICVTLAALAAMVAEAFREQGRADADWRPRRDRARLRPGRVVPAVGTRRAELRSRPRRQLRPLHHHHALHRRTPDDRLLGADHPPGRPAAGRVLRPDAVRDRGHDADGDGHGSAHDLPGARDPVDFGLRDDGAPPRFAAGDRGGVQVLPARRVRERVLPLRHGADLHAHRIDAARARRHVDGGRGHADLADDAGGHGPAPRRLRVQDLGGAVPHVDAGRLRGRAHGRDRLHVHGRQGGGVRGVRPRVPVGVRADAGRLDSRSSGAWRC